MSLAFLNSLDLKLQIYQPFTVALYKNIPTVRLLAFALHFGINHCKIAGLFVAQESCFVVRFPLCHTIFLKSMEPSMLEDRGHLELFMIFCTDLDKKQMRQPSPLWFMIENCGYKQNTKGFYWCSEILISPLLMPDMKKNHPNCVYLITFYTFQVLEFMSVLCDP